MTTWRPLAHAAALLALATAALSIRAADADPDADLVAALAARADVRAHAQACEAMAGDASWYFKWGEYFWESGNMAAFHEADAIAASRPVAAHGELDSRVDAAAARLARLRKATSLVSLGASDATSCRDLARQMFDYPGKHDLLGPGVYDRIEKLYERRQGGAEAVRREVQHEDMVNGCAKQMINKGMRDFAPVHGLCVCTIAAIETSTTPSELDAFVAQSAGTNVKSAAAGMLKQPWMEQALPKMKTCAAAAAAAH